MISALLTLLLASLPDATVKVVVECESPELTIIHIRDWHYVDKLRFALDVRDESETELTDDEVNELFAEHRDTVAAVQKQQRRAIRKLVKRCGVKQVFHEGLTVEQLAAYQKRIKTLKDFKPYLPTGDSGLDLLTRYEYQTDMLTIGAPGQLLIEGHIEAVAPVEDARAYEAANPVQADGTIKFDEKASEARETAIVRNLLKASGTAIVVLGGAHDLRNNVPAGVRLLEVTVRGFPE